MMIKVLSISVGLVALSAAGGFALSIGHDGMMNGPRLMPRDVAATSVPAQVTRPTVSVFKSTNRGAHAETDRPLPIAVSAPASSAMTLPARAAAGDLGVATRSNDRYQDMHRTDLAPQTSKRPRVRGLDMAQAQIETSQGGQQTLIARPVPETVKEQIVLNDPSPHQIAITYASPRPVQSRDTRKQPGRPGFEPVPRYLIGVFR